MNITRSDRKKTFVFSSELKLSPDTVCETLPLPLHGQLLETQKSKPLQVPCLTRITTPIMEDEVNGCSIQLLRSTPPQTRKTARPNMPPRSPITGRPRSVSESDVSSTQQRRAIFGQYWDASGVRRGSSSGGQSTPLTSHKLFNTGALHHLPTSLPPQRNHTRSSSLTTITAIGRRLEPKDYRMYAPPKEHAERSSICGRFASVEDVPMSPMLESLPPLPSPLQRLCCDGDTPGCLQGMYPMVVPVPILRQSSFRSLQEYHQNTGGNRSGKVLFSKEQLASFNLTRSLRLDSKVASFGECSGSDTSSTEASSTGTMKTGVRFDPRVTVTEFEDPVERCWYNDDELEQLKHDTIVLVQEYLLTHPDEAERYNRMTLDPITGTYRKKALFSLSVLSASEDTIKPTHKEYEQLIKSHVRSILIVDPNKAILDLFCKSMHSMFPYAHISKAATGSEALQWANAPQSHFDIVIVEERLEQPMVATLSNGLSTLTSSLDGDSGQRFLSLHKTMSEQGPTNPVFYESLDKHGSFVETSRRPLLQDDCPVCGSSLLRILQNHLDAENPEPQGGGTNGTPSLPRNHQALLIGVSMHPDRDAKAFQAAGADIVWGKPIPRVGETLRNYLVHLLVNKRRNRPCESTPEGGAATTADRYTVASTN